MNPYTQEYNTKKAEYERVKSLVNTGGTNMTDAQKALLLQSKDKLKGVEAAYLAIKGKYDSYGADPVAETNAMTGGTQKVTPAPGSTIAPIETTAATTTEKITAPNGKEYTLLTNGTQYWFDGGYGKKMFSDRTGAIAEITKQNTTGTQAQPGTPANVSTGKVTTAAGELQTDFNKLKTENITGQEDLKTQVIKVDPATIEKDTNTIIAEATQKAKDSLISARELEGEAETIYGDNQIQAQQQDMVKRGLDPSKAGQAALYLNLKGRANLSAKVKQIQSQFDQKIADLEMQKAQLMIDAKNKGVENQKRVTDQYQAIENNIQGIRNDYQANVSGIVEKYVMKPLLDVNSANLAKEAELVAQDMQNKYDTSTPERKIAALSKIL
jgi:hypothetical protein